LSRLRRILAYFGWYLYRTDYKLAAEAAATSRNTFRDLWKDEKAQREALDESCSNCFLDAADLRRQIETLNQHLASNNITIQSLGVEISVLNSKLLAEHRSNNSLRGTITRMKGKKA
jgi:hypothetical protein